MMQVVSLRRARPETTNLTPGDGLPQWETMHPGRSALRM